MARPKGVSPWRDLWFDLPPAASHFREPDFSRGGLNRLSGPLGPGNWITSTPILTRTSRAVYAKGAVRAARWVVGRPPGVYGIREVLGL
jgi:hypothetical protein